MSKLGSYLKKERERQGISIQEIGLSLKISSRVLSAIEEGDKTNLPARTFLRGFIRSYALHLHLDPQQTLHLFNEEFGLPPTPENSPSTPEPQMIEKPVVEKAPRREESLAAASKTRPLPKPSLFENKILTAGVSIFLLIVVVGVIKTVNKYQRERVSPVNPITTQVPEELAAPESSATLTPDTSKQVDATVELDERSKNAATSEDKFDLIATVNRSSEAPLSPVQVSQQDYLTRPTPTTFPTPTPEPQSPPPPTPQATPTPQVAPTPETLATPPPSPTPAAPEPVTTSSATGQTFEIIIEARATVKLDFQSGSQAARSASLSEGEIYTIKARESLVLTLDNGGAASIFVNGLDRGRAPEGKPLTLKFPESE